MAEESFAAWLVGKTGVHEARVASFDCLGDEQFVPVFGSWDKAAAFAKNAGADYVALGYPPAQLLFALGVACGGGIRYASLDLTPAQYNSGRFKTVPVEALQNILERKFSEQKDAPPGDDQDV